MSDLFQSYPKNIKDHNQRYSGSIEEEPLLMREHYISESKRSSISNSWRWFDGHYEPLDNREDKD